MAVGLQPIRRAQVEFAVKAGLGAMASLWVASAVGLEDSYWAAVSAVVATAGTLGASVAASITRVVATLVALVLAVGVVALVPFGGVMLSGVLVSLTLLVMFALSLEAGARLAAASTLIVTAASGGDPVGMAVSRGLNVPLGCAVAVAIGLTVLPRRAGRQLVDDLEADREQAVALAAEALASYVAGEAPGSEEQGRLQALERRVAGHGTTLADAGREPGSNQQVAADLRLQLEAVRSLLEATQALAQAAGAATGDRAPSLVAGELDGVVAALREGVGLAAAVLSLDAAFAAVRERRGTVDYGTDELTRLLAVLRVVHTIASTLDRPSQT